MIVTKTVVSPLAQQEPFVNANPAGALIYDFPQIKSAKLISITATDATYEVEAEEALFNQIASTPGYKL